MFLGAAEAPSHQSRCSTFQNQKTVSHVSHDVYDGHTRSAYAAHAATFDVTTIVGAFQRLSALKVLFCESLHPTVRDSKGKKTSLGKITSLYYGMRLMSWWPIDVAKPCPQPPPVRFQVMLMSSISLGPLLAAVLVPDLHFFDETVNSCNTSTDSRNVVLAMNALGFYVICYLW